MTSLTVAFIGLGTTILVAVIVLLLDRRFYGPGIWPNQPAKTDQKEQS